MSLLEVVFVCGLFAVFTSMVAQALVMAYGAHVKTRDKVHATRQAQVGLNRLAREFRTCRQLVQPAPVSGTWVVPTPAAPLVFRRNSAGGLLEVRYWYDDTTGEIRRLQPGDPSSGRLVAQAVDGFRVRPVLSSETLQAEIDVANHNYHLEARALEL